MDLLLERFVENPFIFAISFAVMLLALAIFVKVIGNPLSTLTRALNTILPYILTELRGRAGIAGLVNLIIVLATLMLAVALIIRPSLVSLFSKAEVNILVHSFIVLLVAAVVFITSLKIVADQDGTKKLFD